MYRPSLSVSMADNYLEHGTGGNDERCTMASRERKLNVFCAVAYSFNVTAHIVVEQVRMKQTNNFELCGLTRGAAAD